MSKMKIGSRITLSVLATVIPLFAITGIAVSLFTVAHMKRAYVNGIQGSTAAALQVFESDKAKIENYIRFLASNPAFQAAAEQGISYGDKDSLAKMLKSTIAFLDVDALEVVDKNGKSVERVTRKTGAAPGAPLTAKFLATITNEQSAIEISPAGVAVVSLAPVKMDTALLGYLRLEITCGAAYLDNIGNQFNADLAVLDGDTVAATSWEKGQEVQLDPSLVTAVTQQHTNLVTMAKAAAGIPNFVAYAPLLTRSASGKPTVLLMTSSAVDYQTTITSTYWGLGGGILLVSLIIGMIVLQIARSIAGPLGNIAGRLAASASQMTASAKQSAHNSGQLAQGASQQASSLEETSASLEEMASMTQQNADNATMANGTAKEASHLADQGVDSMKRMQEAIDRIKSSASETAKIIKTIDEIAFQTNLLALNAAVEAARAGEAGKGFAVVAEEVRNLARRSAEAAKHTADLIEGSQKNADAGVQVTTEVATNLSGIKVNAGKVATLITEIATACKEQTQGISQLSSAVTDMDKVVQQNAANAEESASAAEEIASRVTEVNNMVAELNAIVSGSTTS